MLVYDAALILAEWKHNCSVSDAKLVAGQAFLCVFRLHTSHINIKEKNFFNVTHFNPISVVQ